MVWEEIAYIVSIGAGVVGILAALGALINNRKQLEILKRPKITWLNDYRCTVRNFQGVIQNYDIAVGISGLTGKVDVVQCDQYNPDNKVCGVCSEKCRIIAEKYSLTGREYRCG